MTSLTAASPMISSPGISKEQFDQLSSFWSDSPNAITLYFPAGQPSELSHREEPILLKDMIEQGPAPTGSSPRQDPELREDIAHLLSVVSGMKGNHGLTKVIFACHKDGLWEEFDLPGKFAATYHVGNSFLLAPLMACFNKRKRYCIALADRNRARLLLLTAGEISEHTQVLDEENEKIRTTGASNSTHAERQRGEKVKRHYKFLADHLFHFHEHGDFDALLIGCRDEMWSEIQSTLHPELQRILVGHFRIDPGLATQQEVRELATPIIEAHELADEQAVVSAAAGEAARDGLGATGLPGVLRSLEKGEIRTLLLPPTPPANPLPASTCTSCGHIRLGYAGAECDLCGAALRAYPTAVEAMLRSLLFQGVEVRVLRQPALAAKHQVQDHPPEHQVMALLRFRSDHNTAQALAS